MIEANAAGISGRRGIRPWAQRLILAAGIAAVAGGLIVAFRVGGKDGFPLGLSAAVIGLIAVVFSLFASEVAFGSDRIRRSTLFGAREILWDRVRRIQVDIVSNRYETCGVVVLSGEDMPRIRFTVEPGALDSIRRRLSERCPRAFVEDQRTGTIAPPWEGGAGEIRRGAEAIVRDARRYYRRMASLWFFAGGVGLIGASVLAVFAVGRGRSSAILPCIVLVAFSIPCFPLGKSWLARIRTARESLRPEDRSKG